MSWFESHVDQVVGWMTFLAAAIGGRIMFHIREVRRGVRPLVSRDLWLELPIAMAMGFIASGICEYQGWHGDIKTGIITLVSYLGPRWIDILAERAEKADWFQLFSLLNPFRKGK